MTLWFMHIVRLPLPRLMHPQSVTCKEHPIEKPWKKKQAFGDSNTKISKIITTSSLPTPFRLMEKRNPEIHQLIQLVVYHNLSPVQLLQRLYDSIIPGGLFRISEPSTVHKLFTVLRCCLLLQVLNIHCRIMLAACGQGNKCRESPGWINPMTETIPKSETT